MSSSHALLTASRSLHKMFIRCQESTDTVAVDHVRKWGGRTDTSRAAMMAEDGADANRRSVTNLPGGVEEVIAYRQ